jgi:hypothetical protein
MYAERRFKQSPTSAAKWGTKGSVPSEAGGARELLIRSRQGARGFSKGHLEPNHVVGLHAGFDNRDTVPTRSGPQTPSILIELTDQRRAPRPERARLGSTVADSARSRRRTPRQITRRRSRRQREHPKFRSHRSNWRRTRILSSMSGHANRKLAIRKATIQRFPLCDRVRKARAARTHPRA